MSLSTLGTLPAVQLALLAYDEPIENKNIVFISEGSTQVTLRYCGDICVISFRGTEDVEDWFTDGQFVKSRIPCIGKGKVHSGFAKAYALVRTQITNSLLEHRIKNLYFASHSLGAALSVICARDIELNWCLFKIKGVYLFGCPRVFNKEAADAYDEHLGRITHRWVNNCDIVCRVPKLFYKHVGTLKYINRNGELLEPSSWGGRFFDRVVGNLKGLSRFKIDSFADHKIENYKHKIKGLK